MRARMRTRRAAACSCAVASPRAACRGRGTARLRAALSPSLQALPPPPTQRASPARSSTCMTSRCAGCLRAGAHAFAVRLTRHSAGAVRARVGVAEGACAPAAGSPGRRAAAARRAAVAAARARVHARHRQHARQPALRPRGAALRAAPHGARRRGDVPRPRPAGALPDFGSQVRLCVCHEARRHRVHFGVR